MQDDKHWLRNHGVHSVHEVWYYLDCLQALQASASKYK